MALIDKLTAIADAIRAKSGKSDPMTLDEMPNEIGALSVEEQLPSPDFPDYVRTEAAAVAAKVRAVLKDDSIVSIKVSDSHYVGDTADDDVERQTDKGNIHACMAIKALKYLLPVDYIAHLGDVGKGTITENNTVHKKELLDYLKYFREAAGNIPLFVAIGNHDTAIYYHNGQTDGGVHTLPADWLYENFTALSESDNTVVSGESCGGYCYRDFADKKLRVFLLNTSENLVVNQYDNGTSETQRLWVAKALKELNTKSDAASWGFVVLSHYALDYGDAWRISQVFKDYIDGDSHTANGETVNFSGSNSAKFYAQFHGHWHCFKHDNLHADMDWTNAGGTLTPYGVWRLCTPNASYNSENNYKDRVVYGVSFGEDVDYPKTPNTGDDTSFVVDVINPSEQMIYSFVYGAGYDRTIDMTAMAVRKYGVTKNLTFASVTDENGTMIEEGESYSCKIVVNDDYTIDTIKITMGGVDITSTAYNASTGMVTIPSVTGAIVITVVAEAPPVNLVSLATTTDGVTIFGEDYNGDGANDGYQKSMILGSSKEYSGTNYAKGFSTGYININPKNHTLTLKNFGTTDVYYSAVRIIAFGRLEYGSAIQTINLKTLTADSEGNLVITPDKWTAAGNPAYIRVSGYWTGNAPEIYAD